MRFVFNPFRASEELTPHQLRQPKMMAWLRVLLRPLKYLADLSLKRYCTGSDMYSDWDIATTYVKGNRAIWVDGGVYESRVDSNLAVQPTGAALSTTNWRKLLNSFIGIDEEVRYNGQLIVFEYAINRYFGVTAAPYIYVEPITLGAIQVFTQIYVPAAVFTALGPNAASREARVKEFAVKYVLADHTITVDPY